MPAVASARRCELPSVRTTWAWWSSRSTVAVARDHLGGSLTLYAWGGSPSPNDPNIVAPVVAPPSGRQAACTAGPGQTLYLCLLRWAPGTRQHSAQARILPKHLKLCAVLLSLQRSLKPVQLCGRRGGAMVARWWSANDPARPRLAQPAGPPGSARLWRTAAGVRRPWPRTARSTSRGR